MSKKKTVELYCPVCGDKSGFSVDDRLTREEYVEVHRQRQQGENPLRCFKCEGNGKTVLLEVH